MLLAFSWRKSATIGIKETEHMIVMLEKTPDLVEVHRETA